MHISTYYSLLPHRYSNAVAYFFSILCLLCLSVKVHASPDVNAPSEATAENTTQASKKHILVLGDSLSAAYNISWEAGWANLLNQKLANRRSEYAVINASMGGATTRNGVQRLPSLLAEHTPHLVIIELGANDGLQGKPIPYIRKNLKTLMTLSTNYGAKVMLVGNKLPPNLGKRYTDPFFALYPSLAKEFNVPFVPFMLEHVAGNSALMQDDGLHPKASAQTTILNNIWPEVVPLLGLDE